MSLAKQQTFHKPSHTQSRLKMTQKKNMIKVSTTPVIHQYKTKYMIGCVIHVNRLSQFISWANHSSLNTTLQKTDRLKLIAELSMADTKSFYTREASNACLPFQAQNQVSLKDQNMVQSFLVDGLDLWKKAKQEKNKLEISISLLVCLTRHLTISSGSCSK